MLILNRRMIVLYVHWWFGFTATAVTVSGILGHSILLPCNLSTNSSGSDRAVLILWYKHGIDTPIYRLVLYLTSLSWIFCVHSKWPRWLRFSTANAIIQFPTTKKRFGQTKKFAQKLGEEIFNKNTDRNKWFMLTDKTDRSIKRWIDG